jgi:hypothetical protein
LAVWRKQWLVVIFGREEAAEAELARCWGFVIIVGDKIVR